MAHEAATTRGVPFRWTQPRHAERGHHTSAGSPAVTTAPHLLLSHSLALRFRCPSKQETVHRHIQNLNTVRHQIYVHQSYSSHIVLVTLASVLQNSLCLQLLWGNLHVPDFWPLTASSVFFLSEYSHLNRHTHYCVSLQIILRQKMKSVKAN